MRELYFSIERDIFLSKRIVINQKDGLNLFFARQIVQAARYSRSEINLIACKGIADAKNILEILTLMISEKESVLITARGEDAQEVLLAILHILEKNILSAAEGAKG